MKHCFLRLATGGFWPMFFFEMDDLTGVFFKSQHFSKEKAMHTKYKDLIIRSPAGPKILR